MIFVTLGSREYQFNRLLKELDRLKASDALKEEIFAQIGGSDYEPKHYSFVRFLDREQFEALQEEADLIISHAGTGALISALKKGKKVISVPRLVRYKEHIDDHQLQISSVLSKEGYLWEVLDIEFLGSTIQVVKSNSQLKLWESRSRVLSLIEDFLQS